jgi:hypothetical protein
METSKNVYGPGGNLSLRMTPGLSSLLLEHNKYQLNLPFWDQYLIWRYTLGSGSITSKLVGQDLTERSLRWTYEFFSHYNLELYGEGNIGYPFRKYLQFFRNHKSYLAQNIEIQTKVANEILIEYSRQLERIILASPPTEAPIVVFKVSRYYDDLPALENGLSEDNSMITSVYQKPFNSTTYDPQFNFLPFLADKTCCLHVITIPKCSRVLAISSVLHAYPHEREILLPFGTTFNVIKVESSYLNLIPLDAQKFIKIQNKPYVIGEVYRIDPLACTQLLQTLITTYISDSKTPYISC